ncbi:hypothetical protein MVEN_00043300 [Mycena venus]|uniref:Chromo domain-containing protein n=1 Tax=Mycena venus TaxID=2733690 RepID=A0A8H7DGZ0_9AGAR|nr:hypothetical protein MVEN_00043300 [Mycena venus]
MCGSTFRIYQHSPFVDVKAPSFHSRDLWLAAMSSVPYHISDSVKTRKRSYPTKSKEEVSHIDGQQSGAEDEDSGDDEEEFEIEAILEAEKDQFRKNKYMYLVKWKGYGTDHNSWVAEDDAGNATLLIKAFWDEKKSHKNVTKTPSKRARKSMQASDAPDVGSSASVAKNRGRKSVSEKPADTDDEERPAKKSRKASEKRAVMADARTTTSTVTELLPDKEEAGTTSELMHAPTWDQLIERIDTVEREDETLYVYFTLNGGERIREDSKICADKFPKLLIDFYEAHLRWTEANH